MSTNKKIDIICVVVLICAIVLTVLFMNGEKLGVTVVVDEDSEANSSSENFTSNDLNGDWDTSEATIITLNGDDISVSGTGAYANDGNLYITQTGYYVVSGTLTDGSIVVDAEQYSKIWIMLDGVDIYCEDDAGIIVDQADKVFLTLAEDSVNTISTGSEYSDEALEDSTSGAIFSHDDLTINGSGTLTVTTEYKHGIVSKDDLVITGGTISVTAPEDGLKANDALKIAEADITINVEDDGINSDGNVYIESGTILIENSYEGIEALIIDIVGGDITIYASDDGLNANGGTDSFAMGGNMGNGMANFDAAAGAESSDTTTPVEIASDSNETEASEDSEEEEETYISISGGTLTIYNENGNDADGIDSNGDIYISGGTILVSMTNGGMNNAIDYASENGAICVVTGGTIIAAGSSGMVEQFDSSSTQASILYTYSAGAEAGTVVSVEDSSGNTVLSWTVPYSFSSLQISSPDLTVGDSYTIKIGDNSEVVTIEEVVTTAGDTAASQTGGMGQMGAMGQMKGGMGRMSQEQQMEAGNTENAETTEESENMTAPESSEDMTMPQDGGMTGKTGMMQGHGGGMGMFEEQQVADTEETTETTETTQSLSEVDAETWILLGMSLVVLIAGLGFAIFYKKGKL